MPTKKGQPGKRGAKDYFTGSRYEFLSSYRDEYISLRGKSRSRFWHKLFEEWWKTYPWRLADDEEPPINDPEKMKALSQVGNDDGIERDLKRGIEKQLQKKITTWFSYRANVHNSRHEGGVWSHILEHVHERANVKPRCRSLPQQFMFENPQAVNAAFEERFGQGTGLSQVQKMNHRNELAKSLVETTYKHLTEDLAARVKEAHEQELKEWGLCLEDIGEAEDVQLACDSLFSAVHPLLNFIGRYSGCYVTLLAASASTQENGKPYFSTVHYFPEDKPRRKNWAEYNEQAFKTGVAGPFVKYIQWMEGEEGEESTAMDQLLGGAGTAVAFQQLPPAGPPRQLASTFRQPVNSANWDKISKKRMMSPEPTDEDSIHLIRGHSSSSSLVDPDELPAKRLRRSTIIARGSDNIASLQTPATPVVVDQDSLLPSNGLITIGDHYTLGMQTPSSPSLRTDTDSVWEFDVSDIDIPGGTASLQFRQSGTHSDPEAELSPTSPDPPLNTEPIIPEFLTAKHNIYGYLVNINEPKFIALLDNYIAFELAEHSGIRGVLPTTHRPTAVTWWTSRARPDRIPPFDCLEKFGSGVIEWWIFIQPDWRRIKCGETHRGSGCWECLYQPGINGLLNIIILVYWWAKTLEEGGKSGDMAYCWLVEDVTWVLSQLARVASEGFSPE